MSKAIIVGTSLAVLGLGGLALGAYQGQQFASEPEPPAPVQAPVYAEVLGVEPAVRRSEVPRKVCEEVVTYQQAPTQDPNRLLGTAAGAVVGGLLGNQVGGGNGRKLATLAGAVGGGLAGREVQSRVEANQRQAVTERQCHTVTETHEEHLGYNVTYRLDDEVRTQRLDNPPQAERLPVVEGQVQWQATAVAERDT
ncbi:glycine zipper 2TM domain-containing protein [Bisbaumannia pacifica]|uniref:Glycine zipper 2TM domain-containing protein n=1 Tax=Bisbaumannia pacifica TaxID=77098 RepID=A0ABD4L2G1_9GAMM|nr:glycine zipper 2TM domain-containing protein [Halomonas pacifica]MBH8579802.1 glycine zipper 2TM domain-containing protein [Halomonas pacifica]